MNRIGTCQASAALKLAHLNRNRAFVFLTALAAVSLLVMVSLFGLTGAYAPVALINLDNGPQSKLFIQAMLEAHHSFALKYMDLKTAETALFSGKLVGIVTIPPDFTANIERGS